MRWVWLVMVVVLAALQYRLWWGDGGLHEVAALDVDIERQREVNDALRRRNDHLVVEVRELQSGLEGIEEQAREEMGMIRQGETFFLYIPSE